MVRLINAKKFQGFSIFSHFSDIMKFLQDEKNIRARNADQSKAYWLRFLNALAQTGSVRAVKEVFELFLEKEYIDISGPNVGSLVKVHLVR